MEKPKISLHWKRDTSIQRYNKKS